MLIVYVENLHSTDIYGQGTVDLTMETKFKNTHPHVHWGSKLWDKDANETESLVPNQIDRSEWNYIGV